MIQELKQAIDHTLLKADATQSQIEELCQEARENSFFSVCVNSRWIAFSKEKLKGTSVKVVTVVGFPLGANLSQVKAFEAKEAIVAGADEIDMVIDVGAIKSQKWSEVEADIKNVVSACGGHPVKVILETSYLNDAEIVEACRISCRAGAKFVKTSTGFASAGATEHHVRLMRSVVGNSYGVKASGGIRDTATAKKMIAAGANRLGTSASVAIVKGIQPQGSGY
jgi:deoxyribose-phosphate aldolase